MARVVDLEGAAHLVLTDAVVPLHPHEAVFDARLATPAAQPAARARDAGDARGDHPAVPGVHEWLAVAALAAAVSPSIAAIVVAWLKYRRRSAELPTKDSNLE
jgi:hypothetical protein